MNFNGTKVIYIYIYYVIYMFFSDTIISCALSTLTTFNKDSLYFYDLSVLLLYIFDTAEWKATGKSGEEGDGRCRRL